MDAILLFSHGSVLCGAERNLLDLAHRMRERGDAPVVEVGFLNYTEPTFAAAVDRCASAGATRVLVAPFFLVEGKFVVHDLPAAIGEARARHPALDIRTAGVIGFHASLTGAVLDSAAAARPPHAWLADLRDNRAWCRENPKCPLHGTSVCRHGHDDAPAPSIPTAARPAEPVNGKRALLVIAHGSPRPEANEPVLRLAEALREQSATVVAFLDCNDPAIPAAIDLCVAHGATAIDAVPFFLHSGKHFLIDVPELLEDGMRRHPGVAISMGDYVGHMPQIADVLRDRVAAVR